MTGKIDKRRKRILELLAVQPKGIKVLARELNLSNTTVKKDINEMVVERKVTYCTKSKQVCLVK